MSGVTTLEIGRLHARYDAGADPAALDPVLHRVAATGLADALERTPLPAAYAVCVRTLTVPVHLDPAATPAAAARTWADLILAALRARLDDPESSVAPVAGDGEAVVVYRSEREAVLDLVRGVARGDTRRAWAWRQVGLVTGGTTPGRAAVAAALGERPHLVPAVAAAVPRELRRALDAAGWVHVAHRVAEAAGLPVRPAPVVPAIPAGAPIPGALVDRVRMALPAAAWGAADADEHRTVADRTALAVLALLLTEPARARDATLVRRVAAGEAILGEKPAVDTDQPTEPVDEATPVAPPEPEPAIETDAPADDVTADEPLTTAWGGVLYLLHAVTALGIPADDPDLLAHALAEATGAPADDPAVVVVAGLPEPRPRRLTEPENERAIAQAGALRTWTLDRLEEDDDVDLDWVWRRFAVLDVQPGWVEAELRLADVDVRIRRAGLDLDPGFVWWLGTVVRFRHA